MTISHQTEQAIAALREYLDQIAFVQIYKYIASVNLYYMNPSLLTWQQTDQVADLPSYVSGDCSALGLALALMLKIPLDYHGLTPLEQRVADGLLAAGLLLRVGDHLAMGPYQLISVQDLPLLVDSRVNFPGEQSHEVYFGCDSLLLTYYVDTAGLQQGDRALDLGTGSGLVGMFLAKHAGHVTVTDIAPQPLRLAHLNRLLNRRTATVEIRNETYQDTLARGERYKVITFNPPFIALPQELRAPIFAKGPGLDGLDYYRMLIARLDDVLTPDGVAYMVADLLGTVEGPFFFAELRDLAARHGLAIDLFIDSRNDYVAGTPQFRILGTYLHRENPSVSENECARRVEELHRETLGATCTLLSVMMVRRARDVAPGVRVFNRKKALPLGQTPPDQVTDQPADPVAQASPRNMKPAISPPESKDTRTS